MCINAKLTFYMGQFISGPDSFPSYPWYGMGIPWDRLFVPSYCRTLVCGGVRNIQSLIDPLFFYRNEPQDTKIVCCDGLALQRNQLYPFLHEWIDEFFEFSNRLHVVNIDLSSMACLSALALLVPELKDLQEPQKIIKMRDDCHDWLANNCRVNENVSDRQGYREKVLSVLHFVHEVSF